MKDCEMCKGKGSIPYRDGSQLNPKQVYGRTPCGVCKGTGKIKEEKKPRFQKVYK